MVVSDDKGQVLLCHKNENWSKIRLGFTRRKKKQINGQEIYKPMIQFVLCHLSGDNRHSIVEHKNE